MHMIVGLGNPGREYEKSKHNTGFRVIDELASRLSVTVWRNQMDALVAQTMNDGEKILLVKPQTYMNNSGAAVGPLMRWYKLDETDVYVIYDDMDLPVGRLRIRTSGSAGGHNGIKSIIAHLGTEKFKRLRIGIDHPAKQKVVDWVLTRFSSDQRTEFDVGMNEAVDAIDDWLENDDFMKTMNRFNKR